MHKYKYMIVNIIVTMYSTHWLVSIIHNKFDPSKIYIKLILLQQ